MAAARSAIQQVMAALDCGPGMARDRLSRAQEVLEQACDSQAELAEITIADIIDSAINGLHNGD